MDPNANLTEQRRIAQRILKGSMKDDDANRLAELVEALDEWIVRGGALPKSWEPQLPLTGL